MIRLSNNALLLLKKRYLLKNSKGKVIEDPSQMFRRVAKAIASADKRYKQDYKKFKKKNFFSLSPINYKKSEKDFFKVMSNLDFLPNSPTLMNAGTKLGQLAACFVLPIEDSIDSIFKTLDQTAIIHQSGGGTGFNFSNIRPKGSLISTSKGKASGPVSFIEIYNKATDVIKQGGKRRGANMGILNIDHPDILEFINAKQRINLENFNLSVALTDKFMKSISKNKKSKKIFDALVENSWKTGDPGVIFIDEINRKNMLKLGRIECTNPCGEVPLYPYESCTLGSINLSNMIIKDEIARRNQRFLVPRKITFSVDWKKLGETIDIAVHFLDNVIDANKYPLPIIEKTTKANRKIGLGVMGFAEMLIKLDIPYDSKEAVKTAEEIMNFINSESKKASMNLASKRRVFPNFNKSKYKQKIRNATTTAIAPTGSLSMIADTSSGIEPLFAVKYKKMVLGEHGISGFNKLYKQLSKKYSSKRLKELFKTAYDINPEQHVKIQAAFQKYTDNAVSKTVNLPAKASKEDVKKIFLLAYKLGCKGITIYRQGSYNDELIRICEVCKT